MPRLPLARRLDDFTTIPQMGMPNPFAPEPERSRALRNEGQAGQVNRVDRVNRVNEVARSVSID